MARVATIQQHELDVLRAAHMGPCYVQLTMRKDGFTQVDADVLHCLALRLVAGHSKCWPDRKLPPLECERHV